MTEETRLDTYTGYRSRKLTEGKAVPEPCSETSLAVHYVRFKLTDSSRGMKLSIG
jgi:hypothetical protein